MLKLAVLCLCIYVLSSQKAPPVWPEHFSQRFVEEFFVNGSRHTTTGEHWYDASKNRSKLLRRNGANDLLCSSVQPGGVECVNLVVGGKRYLVFPQLRKGCFCCDASHGCGILRRDWLNEAKYEGVEVLSGEAFDKWSKPDGPDLDYYYASTDSLQIPRRLNEADTHIVEYMMNTYTTSPIADSVFVVPDYVTGDCPESSKCGKFRAGAAFE